MASLTEAQYRVLLVFRSALRRYLRWSADEAEGLGLTPQQHQLLLVLRAHPGPAPPSIREVSEHLLIRHHSTVELCKRAEIAGWVAREADTHDQRVVRVGLTAAGRDIIEKLSMSHMDELQRVSDLLGISEELLEHLSQEFSEDLLDAAHGDGPIG